MKRFKFLAFLLAMIAGVSLFVACSKDNDDDDNVNGGGSGSSTSSLIIGTWKQTYSWGYETMTFKNNGTGFSMEVDYDYPDEGSYVEEFKWSLKGDVLAISWLEDSYSYGDWETERYKVVSVDSRTLVLKYLPDYDDSYYGSEDEYEVWTRQ